MRQFTTELCLVGLYNFTGAFQGHQGNDQGASALARFILPAKALFKANNLASQLGRQRVLIFASPKLQNLLSQLHLQKV